MVSHGGQGLQHVPLPLDGEGRAGGSPVREEERLPRVQLCQTVRADGGSAAKKIVIKSIGEDIAAPYVTDGRRIFDPQYEYLP